MVVPYRNPRELLVASHEVQISAVSSEPPSIIVKSEDLAIWLRDAANAVTPTIVAILVFIDVVSEMHNVVDGILVILST